MSKPKLVRTTFREKVVRLRHKEIAFMNGIIHRANQYVERTDPIRHLEGTPANPADVKVLAVSLKMPNPNKAEKKVKDYFGFRTLTNQRKKSPPKVLTSYSMVQYSRSNEELAAKDLVSSFEDCLIEFQEHSPQFIVLNELAVSYKRPVSLINQLERVVAIHHPKAILIPGTFHCTKTGHSVSGLRGPLSIEANANRDTTWLIKKTAAHKVKEFIRTPNEARFDVYDTVYGRVVVWICSDMYAPSYMLSLLWSNLKNSDKRVGSPIDLVLIPGYNTDAENHLIDSIRSISEFARTSIVLVNDSCKAGEGDQWSGSHCCFFGKELAAAKSHGSEKLVAKLFSIDWKKRREKQAKKFDDIYSSTLSAILGITEDSYQ